MTKRSNAKILLVFNGSDPIEVEDGKAFTLLQRDGKWVPDGSRAKGKTARRNVYAVRQHIALSEVTEKNIGDVFAYCNVAGKMRCIRKVPASIDPKALTLEFMAPAEFKAAFVNRTDREFVELEVLTVC